MYYVREEDIPNFFPSVCRYIKCCDILTGSCTFTGQKKTFRRSRTNQGPEAEERSSQIPIARDRVDNVPDRVGDIQSVVSTFTFGIEYKSLTYVNLPEASVIVDRDAC